MNLGPHPRVDAALHARDATRVDHRGELLGLDRVLAARWHEVVSVELLALVRHDRVTQDIVERTEDAAVAELPNGGERVDLAANVVAQDVDPEPSRRVVGGQPPAL